MNRPLNIWMFCSTYSRSVFSCRADASKMLAAFLCVTTARVLTTLLLGTFFINSGASADQTDEGLPPLFDALENASSSSSANDLESRIWQIWLQSDDEKTRLLLQQVVDAMGAGDLDEALLSSTELVEYAPEFAEGWNKRATVYYLMGQFNSSVEDIYRTLKLEPRHFGAISGLGLIFLRQGNQSAALQAFEQVLEVSPKSVNAQRSVDQVRKQLGDEI